MGLVTGISPGKQNERTLALQFRLWGATNTLLYLPKIAMDARLTVVKSNFSTS